MEEIDLGTVKKVNVKLNGESYKISLPTALQAQLYGKNIKGKEGSEVDVFMDFLVDLGMPEGVAEGLTINQLTTLSEGLMGASKKN